MSGRLAVGVSGAGSNLRALHAATEAGDIDASIVLVFADRDCVGLAWAAEQGIDTALVPVPSASDAAARASADTTLAETLVAVAPNLVVLAGYMKVLGPETLAAFEGRIVNTHPSLLPAFPGAHPVRDTLAAGARVTGATVHLVDTTLDGGPILAQERIPIVAGDDESTLHERIKDVEHRLLPRVVGQLLAAQAARVAHGATAEPRRAATAATAEAPAQASTAPRPASAASTSRPRVATGQPRR